jgi:hypothetical protein
MTGNTPYPEVVGDDDDGTMPQNVSAFADAIVGHRITSVIKEGWSTLFTLDTGTVVRLSDQDDCCAYTQMESVLANIAGLDHVITRVEPSEDYSRWHILADFGQVLELNVGWSAGNPFYYTHGFSISVEPAKERERG